MSTTVEPASTRHRDGNRIRTLVVPASAGGGEKREAEEEGEGGWGWREEEGTAFASGISAGFFFFCGGCVLWCPTAGGSGGWVPSLATAEGTSGGAERGSPSRYSDVSLDTSSRKKDVSKNGEEAL